MEKAAEYIIEKIDNSAKRYPVELVLESTLLQRSKGVEKIHEGQSDVLRILMLDSAASYAVSTLLPLFEKQFGVKTEVDVVSYSEIYKLSTDKKYENDYDIIQLNTEWMNEIISSGMLLSLDEYKQELSETLNNYTEPILEQYSYRNHQLYGLPFMYDMQTLFYRTDLFSDLALQRNYYQLYKEELDVPKTWEEYLKIARFFTRKFNPDSPTEYGTTLGCGDDNSAIYELLPRVWSNHSDIFSQDYKFCLIIRRRGKHWKIILNLFNMQTHMLLNGNGRNRR